MSVALPRETVAHIRTFYWGLGNDVSRFAKIRMVSRSFGIAEVTARKYVDAADEARAPARPGWQPHLALEEPAGYNYLNPWLEGEP